MPILPPPNCTLLQQAFETLAARDATLAKLGFAQAMQHRTWAQVIDCRARALRTAQFKANATRRVQLQRRFNPATGAWVTQRVAGGFDETQSTIVAGTALCPLTSL